MKKKLAAGIFAAVFFTMFATVTVWAEKSTVLEQVIYDENNIKVSVSEASLDAEQNIVIPLHIENNTDEKMGLIAENCYINGCKVEANSLFFDKAEPGGETDGLLVVSKQECDGYGIDRVADVEPDWIYLDTDENGITMNSYFVQTYDDIAVVDNISIKTDIRGSYEQEIGGGGIVLYDDKGVKIIEKGIVKNSVMGLTPRFCVVNDTEQDIDVRCRNVKVNGKECKTANISCEGIPAGKSEIVKMYFLGKNAGINELSVSFRVFQKDNDSKVICKTDDFVIGYGGADKK